MPDDRPRRSATQIDSPDPQPRGRVTTPDMDPGAGYYAPEAHRGSNRKIVGVLASYTWREQGDVYPIYQGRNFIGRGYVDRDPDHGECDVMCRDDEIMSEEHALILCRAGHYHLSDRDSANGTFLNGSMITQAELKTEDEIRAGKTIFRFLSIPGAWDEADVQRPIDQPAPRSEPRPSEDRTSDTIPD